jgi:hypothetical protein
MCGINLIFQINKTIDYNNRYFSKLPKKGNTFKISIAQAIKKDILFIFLLNQKIN